MRSSILSRAVVAAAAVAVGPVAFVSAPANATSATGITREQVLDVTAGLRSGDPTDAQLETMKTIVRGLCDTSQETESSPLSVGGRAVTSGQPADGVLLTANIQGFGVCTVFALTTVASASTLAGTATINGVTFGPGIPGGPGGIVFPSFVPTSATEQVSGDVFVTVRGASFFEPALEASGDVVTTRASTTTTEIRTPKTAAQKKAAKKIYDRKLSKAKKAYKKAVAKAGESSKKKARASKTYRAAKATARARYRAAVAPTNTSVSSPSAVTTRTPFAVTTVPG
jgi:hypothetical protein